MRKHHGRAQCLLMAETPANTDMVTTDSTSSRVSFETDNSRYEFDTDQMVYRRSAINAQDVQSARLEYDEWLEYTEFRVVRGRLWFNTPGGVYGVVTSPLTTPAPGNSQATIQPQDVEFRSAQFTGEVNEDTADALAARVGFRT